MRASLCRFFGLSLVLVANLFGSHAAWGADLVFCNGFESVACPASSAPFLVVPNRVLSALPTQITVFLTADPFPVSPGPPISGVDLVGPASQVVSLSIVSDPATPNRVDAIVPAGLAAGSWDVRTTTNVGYVATLPQGLSVISANTLTLTGLAPSVVSNSALTRATLSASGGLLALPEVFLHDHFAPSANAIRMEDREFVSSSAMTLSIPAGLATATYDVIAINSDGTAGVLSSGLVVVGEPVPVISKLVPEVAHTSSGQAIALRGANLSEPGVESVQAVCHDPSGNDLPAIASASIVGPTSTEVDANFDFSALPSGSVCRIDLTVGDGQVASYSNLAVAAPGQCMGGNSVKSGSTLITGRRGAVLLAGPPAPEGVRLYMIGGDSGTTAGAMSSLESAAVDNYGNLSAFRQESYPLPTTLTLSGGVRVGDYLYLVGGNDSGTPKSVAYRARVLLDQRVPAVTSIGAVPISNGLPQGLWQYRIAPQFPGTDPDNPFGEGEPGAVYSVELPLVSSGNGTQVTLTWSAVAGANGYLVYRSPTAGASTFELVGMVFTNSFTDAGAAASPGQHPRPPGALGTWKPLPLLNSQREAPAVVAAVDPTNALVWYVYAVGGRDSAASVLSSYEYLQLNIAPDGTQTTASAWTLGAHTLSTGRAYLGAWVMDADRAPEITPPDTYIFAGPGANGAMVGVHDVDAGKVAAGGDLGIWDTTPKDTVSGFIGAASAQAVDCMFLLGGLNGTPATNVNQGVLTAPPPALQLSSWNANGTVLAVGRVYAGYAVANGYIFVAGGQSNAPSPADNSVERLAQ